MKKILSVLLCLILVFAVIPFTASAEEQNFPEFTPLIVKEAIKSGKITDASALKNLEICQKIYDSFLQFNTTVDLKEFNISWSTEGFDLVNSCLIYVIGMPEMAQIYKYFNFEDCKFNGYYLNEKPFVTNITFSYLANSVDSSGNDVFDKNLAKQQAAEYEALISQIINTVPENISSLEKLIYLYDYLAVNYEYTPKSESPIYNSYDFLKNKNGVCDAYARTLLYLLEKVGIPSMRALSDEGNHSWNIVSLDGKYYHVDVTWADPVPDRESMVLHDYFLISDTALEKLDTSSHINWHTLEAEAFGLSDFSCTSTKYDSGYLWNLTDRNFCYYNGEYYFIDNTSWYKYQTIGGTRYLIDYETSAEIKKTTDFKTAVTVKKIYSDPWFEKNGSGRFILDYHSGLYMVGSQIYYNDVDTLKYYDISNGEEGIVFSVNESNITGFNYVGDGSFNYTEFAINSGVSSYEKKTYTVDDMGKISNTSSSFAEALILIRKFISGNDSSGLCLLKGDLSGNDREVDVRDLVVLKKLAIE